MILIVTALTVIIYVNIVICTSNISVILVINIALVNMSIIIIIITINIAINTIIISVISTIRRHFGASGSCLATVSANLSQLSRPAGSSSRPGLALPPPRSAIPLTGHGSRAPKSSPTPKSPSQPPQGEPS